MPTIDRDGVRIHWEATGDGPAVLLTHGYTATSRMWEPNLAALAADHRVVTWDIRGHGRSDSPTDAAAYSVDASVADMAAVLDAAGAERAVIAGMSLGGYLSLAFHLRHPDRTVALALVDTGPGFRKDEARAAWNRTAEAYATGFEERGLGALAERAEVRRADHRDPGDLARAARGILAQRGPEVIDSLPSIAVPTVVIVGDRDEPFLAGSRYMASKIPDATYVEIPDAGHASNIDQPERFAAAMRGLLERCAA
ncbi:MAG: alpha/beta fold hydrolase [Actinomycetota bacterium]|nr:alpha/beta fold hydrolase [Actinomycetota bacterium]